MTLPKALLSAKRSNLTSWFKVEALFFYRHGTQQHTGMLQAHLRWVTRCWLLIPFGYSCKGLRWGWCLSDEALSWEVCARLTSFYQEEVGGAVEHHPSTKNDWAFTKSFEYLRAWDCKKALQGSKQSSSNSKTVPQGDQVNDVITVGAFIDSVRHCYTMAVIMS